MKLFFEMKMDIEDGRLKDFNIIKVEENFDYIDIDEDGFINIEHEYFNNEYKTITYGLEGVFNYWLDSNFDEERIKEKFIRTIMKYKDRCETWNELNERCFVKEFRWSL